MANWLNDYDDKGKNPKSPKVNTNESITRSYFDPKNGEIYLNPNDVKDPSILAHEKYHYNQWLQNRLRTPDWYFDPRNKIANEEDMPVELTGNIPLQQPNMLTTGDWDAQLPYYNRRAADEYLISNQIIKDNPSFKFVPYDLIYNGATVSDTNPANPTHIKRILGTDSLMYHTPWTGEGEAQGYQNSFREAYNSGETLSPGEYDWLLTQGYKQGGLIKRADGSYSRRGLWDNIRANRGSGRKPTAEMLRQERKIKKHEDGSFVTDGNGGGGNNGIITHPNDNTLLTLPVMDKLQIITPLDKDVSAREKEIYEKNAFNTYKNFLIEQENANKEGYDSKSGLWFPYKSPEGGTKTLAYGRKLTEQEEALGTYSKGVPTAEVMKMLDSDIQSNYIKAGKYFNATYKDTGVTWESLPIEQRLFLTDYQYGTKSGLSGWPNLTKGVIAYNKATTDAEKAAAINKISSEYKRGIKGQGLLTKRNAGIYSDYITPIFINPAAVNSETVKKLYNKGVTPSKKANGSWVTNSSIPTPTTPSFYDAYPDRTLTNYQMGTDKAPMYKNGSVVGEDIPIDPRTGKPAVLLKEVQVVGKRNTPIDSSNVRESTAVNTPKIKDPIIKNAFTDDGFNLDFGVSYANKLLKEHNVKVDSTGNILENLGLPSSAYYNPFSRTIHYNSNADNSETAKRKYLKRVIAEIPHAIQSDRMGVIPFTVNIGIDALNNPSTSRYRQKGTLENEAHHIIEPQLQDKLYQNAFNYDYPYKQGGFVMYGSGGGVQPFITSDPNLYKQRKQAYADSLSLYNGGLQPFINFGKVYFPNSTVSDYNKSNYKPDKTWGSTNVTKSGIINEINEIKYELKNYAVGYISTKEHKKNLEDRLNLLNKSLQVGIYPTNVIYPQTYTGALIYKKPEQEVILEELKKAEPRKPKLDFSVNEDVQPIAPTPYVPDPVRKVMNPAFNFNVDFLPNRTKEAVVDELGNPRYKYYNGDKVISEQEYKKLTEKKANGGLVMYGPGGGVNTLEGNMIANVLMNRNRDKDFVQRAYAVGDYPNSPMFNLFSPEEFGSKMSHRMAWGEDDNGQTYMFPTIMNSKNEAIKVPNQYADYISSEGYKNATGIPLYGAGSTVWTKQNTPTWIAGTPTPTATQNFRNDRSLNTDLYRIGDVIPTGMNYKTPAAGTYDYNKDIQPYHTMRLHAPDTTMMARHGSYVKKHINSPRVYGNPVNPSGMSEGPTMQRGTMMFGGGGTTGKNESLPAGFMTYESNPGYFDNRAVLYDQNLKFNDTAKRLIYEGKAAFNPTTGELRFINSKPASAETQQMSSRKYGEMNELDRTAATRKVRMDEADKMNQQIADQGYSDNWRQELATSTQSTGDRFRISLKPNLFDDYFNPGVFFGNIASGLGQAPNQAQQTDSYMPYVTSIGTPLAFGAFTKIMQGVKNPFSLVKNNGSTSLERYIANPRLSSTFHNDVNAGIEDALRTWQPGNVKIDYTKPFEGQTIYPANSLYKKWSDWIDAGRGVRLSEDLTPFEVNTLHKQALKSLEKEGLDLSAESNFEKLLGLQIKKEGINKLTAFTNPIVNDEFGNFTHYTSGIAPLKTRDFKEKHAYDIGALTSEELLAMDAYSKGFDGDLNWAMRLPKISQNQGQRFVKSAIADDLQTGILKNKTKTPLTIRRGIGRDYDVIVVDANNYPIAIKKRSELKLGDRIRDDSFMSTSHDIKNSWGDPSLSELIEAPEGLSYGFPNASSFTQFNDEHEMILPKGLIREVIGINPNSTVGSYQPHDVKYFTKIVNAYKQGGFIKNNNSNTWLDSYN